MSDFLFKDTLYVVESTTVQAQDKFKGEMHDFLVDLGKKAKSNNKDISLSVVAGEPTIFELDCYERSHPSLDYGQVNVQSELVGLKLIMKMNVLLRSGYHNYLNIDYVEQLTINGVEFSSNHDAAYVIDFFLNDCMSEDLFDEELLIQNKQDIAKRMTDMRTLSTEVFDHIGNNLGHRYLRIVEDSNGEFPYIKSDIQVSDAEILIVD